MLQPGAPLGYVNKQIGHRNPNTTLTLYADWVKNDALDARLADLLEPDLGTKPPKRAITAGFSDNLTAVSD